MASNPNCFVLLAALLSGACTSDFESSSNPEPERDAGNDRANSVGGEAGNDASRGSGATGAAKQPEGGADSSASGGTTGCALRSGFVDVKDFGAVGDGIADDSAAFQSAAETNEPICVSKPLSHYRITQGIRIQNSIAGDGSMPEIRFDNPSGQWSDSMVKVIDFGGDALRIQGLHLNGGWDGATGAEWSHAVYIGGSQNVTVEGLVIENTYGDGIYVGGGAFTSAQSKSITIQANHVKNPRRCNVGVIHVDGLTISKNEFSKANSYVAAVDIEPNPNGVDSVWNVVVDGNTFSCPTAKAITLYHASSWPDPPGGLGGHMQISNNSGDAMVGVKITGDEWMDVVQTNNNWY